jgi:Na+/glutamate symporter
MTDFTFGYLLGIIIGVVVTIILVKGQQDETDSQTIDCR